MRKILLTGIFSFLTFSALAQNISPPPVAVPVPVAQGGTGAITAAAAEVNLGIPASQDNRFCNGDFLIDQELENAAITPVGSGSYVSDCWLESLNGGTASALTYQVVADAPSPFLKSEKILVAIADPTPVTNVSYILVQTVEGLNVTDLGWGTSGAKSVVVSFWAKSSLTGLFTFSLRNASVARSYVGTYTIAVANTWQYFTTTIVGDTTGTWPTTNAGSLVISFDLGSGPNRTGTVSGSWVAGSFNAVTGATKLIATIAATLNLTNIRLRVGTVDIAYSQRPYSQQLAIAQRYYYKTFPLGTAVAQNVGSVVNSSCLKNPIALGDPSLYARFPVTMRVAPTITTYNPSAANANWRDVTAAADVTVSVDPGSAVGADGVLIATSGTVATLGDVLCIHYTANSRL